MHILEKKKLESLLLAKWTEYINSQQLMRLTLETVRDANYPSLEQLAPVKGLKISVTHLEIASDNLELWVEFVVPSDGSTVIGTHIFLMDLRGTFSLKETYGTRFLDNI